MSYPNVSRKFLPGVLLAALCMVAAPLVTHADTSTATKAETMGGASATGSSAMSADGSAMSTSEFVTKAAQGGLAEVKTGKLAKQQSSNEDVKDFGDTLVSDHMALNSKIEDYAKSNNMQMPDSMGDTHERKYQKLAKKQGDKFDRAFIREQIRGHKKMIKMFERQANSGKNKKLQQIAKAALPTLEDHLEEAQDLKQEMHEQSGSDAMDSDVMNQSSGTGVSADGGMQSQSNRASGSRSASAALP